MPEHGFWLEEDNDGWVYPHCACGWDGPPVLGAGDAADCYGDHRLDAIPAQVHAQLAMDGPARMFVRQAIAVALDARPDVFDDEQLLALIEVERLLVTDEQP